VKGNVKMKNWYKKTTKNFIVARLYYSIGGILDIIVNIGYLIEFQVPVLIWC
jgi:hypothetical protein